MKKNMFFIVLLIIFTIYGFSQDSGFGIGVILGEPTGISCKLWITAASAFDCGVAWSFIRGENDIEQSEEGSLLRLAFHVDYLFHFINVLEVPTGILAFYCGGGGRIKVLDTGVVIGIRIPLGMTYLFEKVPLDIFFEFVPIMEIYPGTIPTGNGGIGIMYFFKTKEREPRLLKK